MPIYEYRCNSCKKVASIFFRSFSDVTSPACPSCQSADMSKLISRPFIVKSEAERFASMDPSRALGKLDNPYDPGAVERWAKERGRELGDELGADFREMAEQMSSEDRPPELYDPGYYYQSRLNSMRMEAEGKVIDEDSGSWVSKDSDPSSNPYS